MAKSMTTLTTSAPSAHSPFSGGILSLPSGELILPAIGAESTQVKVVSNSSSIYEGTFRAAQFSFPRLGYSDGIKLPCHPSFFGYVDRYRDFCAEMGIGLAPDGRSLTRPDMDKLVRYLAEHLTALGKSRGLGAGGHLTVVMGISGDIDSATSALLLARAIKEHGLNCSILGYHVQTDSTQKQRAKRIDDLERFINSDRPIIRIQRYNLRNVVDEMSKALESPKDILGETVARGQQVPTARDSATRVHDLMIAIRQWLTRETRGSCSINSVEATEILLGNFTNGELYSDWGPLHFLQKELVIWAFSELTESAGSDFIRRWAQPLERLGNFYPRVDHFEHKENSIRIEALDNPFSPFVFALNTSSLCQDDWGQLGAAPGQFAAIPGKLQLISGPVLHSILDNLEHFAGAPQEFIDSRFGMHPFRGDVILSAMLFWQARQIRGKDQRVFTQGPRF